jgi:hypothetical protein
MAKIIELILVDSQTRGRGTVDDPVRILTQLWNKDGWMVAEFDPINPQSSHFFPENITKK